MATTMAPPARLPGTAMNKHLRKDQKAPRKNLQNSSVKPVKALNNTAVAAIDAASADGGIGENDDNDDDDGNSGDDESSEDETDGKALSGAKMSRVNHKAHGLAGRTALQDDSDADDDDNVDENGHDDDLDGERQQASARGGSQDDDYAGVEDISDGENSTVGVDDKSIRRMLEEQLVEEFEQREEEEREKDDNNDSSDSVFEDLIEMGIEEEPAISRHLDLHRRSNLRNSDSLFVDLDEDPFVGVPSNEGVYSDMLQDAELAIWRMPHIERKDGESNSQKRVRFEDTKSHASSESDSDEENNDFPDLFAHEDDPLLKQRLALATGQDVEMTNNDFNDADSVYDFDGEEEKHAFELDEISSSDQDESSSDSEDNGDTTDDESAEEQIAQMMAMRKAMDRQNGNSNTPRKPKKVITKATRPPGSTRAIHVQPGKGPVAGTFRLDPTRASMKANENGTEIHVRPPVAPADRDRGFWERAKSVSCGRHGSPQNASYYTIASPGANNAVPAQPLTARDTLGNVFHGQLASIRANEPTEAADEHLPPYSALPGTPFVASTATEASDDDDHPDVKMADFIDMTDSEDDDDPSSTAQMSQQDGMDVFGSSFDANGDQSTADTAILTPTHRAHLEKLYNNRSIIGSFRLNQSRTRHVTSLASHPAQRASASEYNALQKGRRAAGNSPMTPARKSRNSIDLGGANPAGGIRKNFGSPLTGAGVTSRRPRSRGNSIGGALNLAGLNETLGGSPSR